MSAKIPITDERAKQLDELMEFENAVITIAITIKQLINEMFKKHKELNVGMDISKRMAWKKVRDGVASLDNIAFQSKHCDYKKFKKSVCMVKFLMLELIAKCDDSNMRVWQFHNILKSFPTVYSSLIQTIDSEQEAFANLFGMSDNGS